MANNEAGNACRELISAAVMGKLEGLAMRMEQLNDRLLGKLEPIMMPDAPATLSNGIYPPDEVYPRYFEKMREFHRTIERSINSIETALSRTEI